MNKIILALLLVFCPAAPAGLKLKQLDHTRQSVEILRITPTGINVPSTRQIVFKFNQPMVPAARAGHRVDTVPIRISPPLRCRWRWLDSSTLACQLDENAGLQPATTYQLTVSKQLKSLSGRTLAGDLVHRFSTLRPGVTGIHFSTWRSPGTPVIRIGFNMPVFKPSVASNLYLLAGRHQRYRIKVSHENRQAKSLYARYWLIEPIKPLPPATQVRLMVEPGLLTRTGTLKGGQQKQLASFTTFPEFRFLGIRCYNRRLKKFVSSNDPQTPLPRCALEHPVTLRFSTPFNHATILRGLDFEPLDSRIQKLLKSKLETEHAGMWGNHTSLDRPYKKNRVYTLRLNRLLRPFARLRITGGTGLTDLFGQPLRNRIKLHIDTAHLQPTLRLPQPVSVQPPSRAAKLVLDLLNIDRLKLHYKFIGSRGSPKQTTRTLSLPANSDLAVRHTATLGFSNPPGPGLISGRVSVAAGAANGQVHSFLTLLTPFHVHFKFGHFNSLAWVTRLSDGKAVADARVSLVYGRLKRYFEPAHQLGSASTGKSGVVLLPGRATLKQELARYRYNTDARYDDRILYLRIEKNDSLALLPLTSDFLADSGTAPTLLDEAAQLKWRVLTARRAYRPGDAIDYKIYVRQRGNRGMGPAPPGPYRLDVYDPQMKRIHQVESLRLNRFGSYAGRFRTTKHAVTGRYRFRLSVRTDDGKWRPLAQTGRVLLSDAKAIGFQVSNELNAKLYKPGDRLLTHTRTLLPDGRPYAGTEVHITTRLQSIRLEPEAKTARGFFFDVSGDSTEILINQVRRRLDDHGKDSYAYTVPAKSLLYGRLTVESLVHGAHGKDGSARSSAVYAARDRYVGLRHDGWTLTTGEPSTVQLLVVDEQGRPAAGTAVEVSIQHYTRFGSAHSVHRRSRHTHYGWRRVGECRLVSTTQPQPCSFTPQQAGRYRFVASIRDSRGRPHTSILKRWSTGDTRLATTQPGPGHKLYIEPEKTGYRVGEMLRILVKNPYPRASALITVERAGILDYKVVRLEHNITTLTLPVKKDWLPGAYVSVSLMSPAQGKPAAGARQPPVFRIGYTRIQVKDRHRKLAVSITPANGRYRPGQQIRLSVQVDTVHGGSTPVELAVAVIDEAAPGLLQQDTARYDLYRHFYRLGRLALHNFNLSMNYYDGGDKVPLADWTPGRMPAPALLYTSTNKTTAVDSGNDPGLRPPARKTEQPVIPAHRGYWNGQLVTDRQGRAELSFKAPDRPGRWRVLVPATDGAELMGLGQATFEVTK